MFNNSNLFPHFSNLSLLLTFFRTNNLCSQKPLNFPSFQESISTTPEVHLRSAQAAAAWTLQLSNQFPVLYKAQSPMDSYIATLVQRQLL